MVSSKQYFAIKQALTRTEKELINFYELQWYLRRHVPSVEEVVKHLNKQFEKDGKPGNVKVTSVNYYLQRKLVMKALDERGIPWREHSRDELTPEQHAAAITVCNFADERTISQKLDQLGILPTTYYAWLKDPQFSNLVQSLANENLQHIDPVAKTEFAKKVQQGDWNAIKYYLDATGAANSNDAPQSEVLIMMIVEIIQKHVKDPSVMIAIATDIKRAWNNRSLEIVTEKPALMGEVVTDEELEAAKKKLGIS